MNILAFDTCFGAVSAAVRWRSAEGEWLLREAYEARTTGHAERLFPMITEIMEDAGLAFSSIDRIGVTLGPGTFTGVRVGIAAARAFALALDRPVVGITSLAVMAHRADLLIGRERAGRPLAVAVDARRDMIYFQIFPNHTIGAHDALLVTPGQAAARHRAAAGARRRLWRSRGRCRRRRPRRGSIARSATARAVACHHGAWSLYRSTASRRSTCGSRMPSRRLTNLCRGCCHD